MSIYKDTGVVSEEKTDVEKSTQGRRRCTHVKSRAQLEEVKRRALRGDWSPTEKKKI